MDHFFGVFPVEDGKVGAVTQERGVAAQHTGGDGMKSTAPQAGEFAPQQIGYAAHHFFGRFVGEGQEQDALGRNALFEEESDAVDQGTRLAGTGPGDDQGGARGSGHGGVLLGIKFLRVVNLQMDWRAKGM